MNILTYYTKLELKLMGVDIDDAGDLRIMRSVQIFNPDKLRLSGDVRIDCNVILSSPSIIRNTHIGCGTVILGKYNVYINECEISSNIGIYTQSSDYSLKTNTNPVKNPNVEAYWSGNIHIEDCVIGYGSVILPGTELYRSSVGALSMVKGDYAVGKMLVGCPARVIGETYA